MDTYREKLEEVYSQIAPEINDLYEFFRKKKGLEEENDTKKQLEILVAKKYISSTYISDLSLIVDYYERDMIAMYNNTLQNYKIRIKVFLDN